MQGKQLTGQSYIYLAMAYQLAKNTSEQSIVIGNDNGMKGGQNFYRRFTIMTYQNQTLLIEKKLSTHFADFYRAFVINDIQNQTRLHIYEYIDESNDNNSKTWRR